MFLNFLSQKVTNFSSKKKTEKKYFFSQKQIWKKLFLEKTNWKIFFGEKNFGNIFSLVFTREGGNYQANSGIVCIYIQIFVRINLSWWEEM